MILVRDDGFFDRSTLVRSVFVWLYFPYLYLAPLGRYTKESSHELWQLFSVLHTAHEGAC